MVVVLVVAWLRGLPINREMPGVELVQRNLTKFIQKYHL